MRGENSDEDRVYAYVSAQQRVPGLHPLQAIRQMTDTVRTQLSPQLHRLHARARRPSIPPEKRLRALLLHLLYTVPSERLLMEELDCNLLFRPFVGLNMDGPVWDATVYCKNRERLLRGGMAEAFFQQVLDVAKGQALLGDEHVSVDGTLMETWASQKSFKKRSETETATPPGDPGNPTVDFQGQKRSNETQQSMRDPQTRLYKKAKR
jgi:transposase